MRLIRFFQPVLTGMRILLIVAGMFSVAGMMGATSPLKKPARTSSTPTFHGFASLATTSAGIRHEETGTELLYDVSDKPVGQKEPEVRQVMMEVTAYCACAKCCGPNAAGITASGNDTSYNNSLFVAADPSLPFGTKVLIPGYSNAPVEVIDRGSAIRGNKMDVFFPSHEAALEWGRQQLQVTILE